MCTLDFRLLASRIPLCKERRHFSFEAISFLFIYDAINNNYGITNNVWFIQVIPYSDEDEKNYALH